MPGERLHALLGVFLVGLTGWLLYGVLPGQTGFETGVITPKAPPAPKHFSTRSGSFAVTAIQAGDCLARTARGPDGKLHLIACDQRHVGQVTAVVGVSGPSYEDALRGVKTLPSKCFDTVPTAFRQRHGLLHTDYVKPWKVDWVDGRLHLVCVTARSNGDSEPVSSSGPL
jgi:hypothetical protein